MFAQGTVKLADDRLRLTAGVRYTDETKDFRLICLFRSQPLPADYRDTNFANPINFGLDQPPNFDNRPYNYTNEVINDSESSG